MQSWFYQFYFYGIEDIVTKKDIVNEKKKNLKDTDSKSQYKVDANADTA